MLCARFLSTLASGLLVWSTEPPFLSPMSRHCGKVVLLPACLVTSCGERWVVHLNIKEIWAGWECRIFPFEFCSRRKFGKYFSSMQNMFKMIVNGVHAGCTKENRRRKLAKKGRVWWGGHTWVTAGTVWCSRAHCPFIALSLERKAVLHTGSCHLLGEDGPSLSYFCRVLQQNDCTAEVSNAIPIFKKSKQACGLTSFIRPVLSLANCWAECKWNPNISVAFISGGGLFCTHEVRSRWAAGESQNKEVSAFLSLCYWEIFLFFC